MKILKLFICFITIFYVSQAFANTDKVLNDTKKAFKENSRLDFLDLKLQFIFKNMTKKFAQAQEAFKEGNKEQAKKFLSAALFEDYRNSKLEVLIARSTQAGNDQKIQQALRALIKKINQEYSNEQSLKIDLELLEEQIFKTLLQIDKQELKFLKIKDFKEQNLANSAKITNDIKTNLEQILEEYQAYNLSIIDDLQNTFKLLDAGKINDKAYSQLQILFLKAQTLIKANASKNQLKLCFDTINSVLSSTEQNSKILLSFSLMLKEFLQSVIIIALIMNLYKSNTSIIYKGIFNAFFLGVITSFLSFWVFKIELIALKGLALITALPLLFILLFKLPELTKYKNLPSLFNPKMLHLLIFLLLYPFFCEAILSYQALFFDTQTKQDYLMIFIGFGLGLLVLILIFYLFKGIKKLINKKCVNSINFYIIFTMILIFTGKTSFAFIQAGILELKLSSFLNFKPIFWLSIYPLYESLIPQIMVLILLISSILITKQISKKGI